EPLAEVAQGDADGTGGGGAEQILREQQCQHLGGLQWPRLEAGAFAVERPAGVVLVELEPGQLQLLDVAVDGALATVIAVAVDDRLVELGDGESVPRALEQS